MAIIYEVARMTVTKYDDAPYFIVKSEVIGKKRRHRIMAGRYPSHTAAKQRIRQLEKNSAAT